MLDSTLRMLDHVASNQKCQSLDFILSFVYNITGATWRAEHWLLLSKKIFARRPHISLLDIKNNKLYISIFLSSKLVVITCQAFLPLQKISFVSWAIYMVLLESQGWKNDIFVKVILGHFVSQQIL